MGRLILVAAAVGAAALTGCQDTAYGRAVAAQRQARNGASTHSVRPESPAAFSCPTPAPKGSPEYERCLNPKNLPPQE